MSPPSRRWLELRVRSRTGGERGPLLADALVALGGRAVEEREGWYLTHLLEPPDEEAFVRGARARLVELTGIEDLEVAVRWQEQRDWAEIWKRGLGPRRIGPRLIVTPSWEDPQMRPGDEVVVIDPGMAFGTAEHGTTRGCLRLLAAAPLEGASVLDVGAGSGILAIAAAKLGAREVTAVEGDALAYEALLENIARNGVQERVTPLLLWCDEASLPRLGPRDGLVANIESGILRRLLAGFVAALRAGGWLILSGIDIPEWPGMRAEVEAVGFRLGAVDVDGEWASGLFLSEQE